MAMTDPTRIPVIIGVGQLNDRPESPEVGLDPPGLMAAALRLAEADAGGDILAHLGSLAIVDQISWGWNHRDSGGWHDHWCTVIHRRNRHNSDRWRG